MIFLTARVHYRGVFCSASPLQDEEAASAKLPYSLSLSLPEP